jgi:hypothetical protein
MSIVWLTGCATNGSYVELRPVAGTDIQRVTAGSTFVAPTNGYFFSDTYLEDVLQARVAQDEAAGR